MDRFCDINNLYDNSYIETPESEEESISEIQPLIHKVPNNKDILYDNSIRAVFKKNRTLYKEIEILKQTVSDLTEMNKSLQMKIKKLEKK